MGCHFTFRMQADLWVPPGPQTNNTKGGLHSSLKLESALQAHIAVSQSRISPATSACALASLSFCGEGSVKKVKCIKENEDWEGSSCGNGGVRRL